MNRTPRCSEFKAPFLIDNDFPMVVNFTFLNEKRKNKYLINEEIGHAHSPELYDPKSIDPIRWTEDENGINEFPLNTISDFIGNLSNFYHF